MNIEDSLLVDGEGWSILTEIIGYPKYSCAHGLKIQTSEGTVYRFYSIVYKRFFDMPKEAVTYNGTKVADCCKIEWCDDPGVNEQVFFWDAGPKLSLGRVKSIHDGTVTIISENSAYDVDAAIVVKFEHQYLNIENCKNKTGRCECGAIKTERAYAAQQD